MDLTETRYRRDLPALLLLVSLVALLLLGGSYFVEIRIVVEEPRYGDVTDAVQTFWRAVLGVTTIGSFLSGVYTLVGDDGRPDGPPTMVEIKGTGHDIDVYPSGPIDEREDEEDDEGVNEARSDESASSGVSDEDSDANSTSEQSAD